MGDNFVNNDYDVIILLQLTVSLNQSLCICLSVNTNKIKSSETDIFREPMLNANLASAVIKCHQIEKYAISG